MTFTPPATGASATLSPSGAVTIALGVASVAATANATAGGPYSVTVASAGAAPAAAFSLTNTSAAEAPSLVVTTLNDLVNPNDNLRSLREALAYAASLGGSQTVSFTPGLTGTINLVYGLTIGSNVAIAGPGASSLTVSGGGPSSDFSVFTVNTGVTSSISGLTITKGNTSYYGGGILNYGTMTLTGDKLSANSAYGGGGVFNYDGTMTLTGDTLSANSAADQGGGVYNTGSGTMTLIGDTLSANSAGYGGGIHNYGTMTLADDTLSANSASYGGGVYNSGTMTLTGDTLSANTAADVGGGIHNGGTMTLSDATLSANTAAEQGGGVFNYGTMTLTGDTLSANTAPNGGGVYVYSSAGAVTVLNDTILANSTSGGDISGAVSGNNNLIDDASSAGGLTNGVAGNMVGVSPLLAPLGNYGGPTQTMPLLPGSPAIDAGSTALAVDGQGHPLTTDQRGLPRGVGSSVDIGAFESSGFTLTITAGNNQSTTIGTAFPTTLQIKVTPNNAGDPVDGGVVTFTPPATGASATLSPSGAVTITSGAASVTAKANGAVGGPYAITAVAAGSAAVSFSLSNTLQATHVSLAASLANLIFGQPETFTATVTAQAGVPTPTGGTVTFLDAGVAIGTANLVNGLATFTTSLLSVASHTITASYSGAGAYSSGSTGTIVTAVGNGTQGYSGDNGPAAAAMLSQPYGVAVDSAGDVFIADLGNNVVREVVKATGAIITIAGNGTQGYSGDNGPATAARLYDPAGVAVDSAGNVFIPELGNNVIREVVKATGVITTFAGNGTYGYSGDNGAAKSAKLASPNGVAVDAAGNLFIADTGNHLVREVIKATGVIITVAGNGTNGYTGDNGPATSAALGYPEGVAVDAVGDLFIADAGTDVVREVVKATGNIITVAGNGSFGYSGDNGAATAAKLFDPFGVAVDAIGDLFIADTVNNAVREVVKATGNIVTAAGNGTQGYSGDNGPATAAKLFNPYGVAVDAAGNLFVADRYNNVIRQATPAVTVAIKGVATTTSLGTSVSPSSYGQSVSFTATITDAVGVPTGNVEFYDGATDLGPGSTSSGSGTSATSTFTTSNSGGRHACIDHRRLHSAREFRGQLGQCESNGQTAGFDDRGHRGQQGL